MKTVVAFCRKHFDRFDNRKALQKTGYNPDTISRIKLMRNTDPEQNLGLVKLSHCLSPYQKPQGYPSKALGLEHVQSYHLGQEDRSQTILDGLVGLLECCVMTLANSLGSTDGLPLIDIAGLRHFFTVDATSEEPATIPVQATNRVDRTALDGRVTIIDGNLALATTGTEQTPPNLSNLGHFPVSLSEVTGVSCTATTDGATNEHHAQWKGPSAHERIPARQD